MYYSIDTNTINVYLHAKGAHGRKPLTPIMFIRIFIIHDYDIDISILFNPVPSNFFYDIRQRSIYTCNGRGPKVVEFQPLVTLSHTVVRSLALFGAVGPNCTACPGMLRLPQFRVNSNDVFLYYPSLLTPQITSLPRLHASHSHLGTAISASAVCRT